MPKWFILNLPTIEEGESLHGKQELIKHVCKVMTSLERDLKEKSTHNLFPQYFKMLTNPTYPYLLLLKKTISIINHFKVDLRKDNLIEIFSSFLGISDEQANSLLGFTKSKKKNFKYFLFRNERFEIYLTSEGKLLDIIVNDKEEKQTESILRVDSYVENSSSKIQTNLSRIIAQAIFLQAPKSKDTHNLTSSCGSLSQVTQEINGDLELFPCAITRAYKVHLHNCKDLGTVTVFVTEKTYELLIQVFGKKLGIKSVEDLKLMMLIHNYRLGFENLDIGPEEVISDLTF